MLETSAFYLPTVAYFSLKGGRNKKSSSQPLYFNDQERVSWEQGCDVMYINLVPRASLAGKPWEQAKVAISIAYPGQIINMPGFVV